MKIIETISGDEDGDYNIEIEGEIGGEAFSISFGNGEPEDMTLSRDLSDAYSIADLLENAYKAGKRGEEFSYQLINEE